MAAGDRVTDAALERSFIGLQLRSRSDGRSQPDWAMVHRELKRAGVTLQPPWGEYRAAHRDGHG